MGQLGCGPEGRDSSGAFIMHCLREAVVARYNRAYCAKVGMKETAGFRDRKMEVELTHHNPSRIIPVEQW